jgi:hypothetical protein
MPRLMRVVMIWLGVLVAAHAVPNKAHVHGTATLNMAQSAGRIHLNLTLSADSVIGFEHSPQTPQELARLTQALATLRQSLFTFYTHQWSWRGKKHIPLALVPQDQHVGFTQGIPDSLPKTSSPNDSDHHHDHHNESAHDASHGSHHVEVSSLTGGAHAEFTVRVVYLMPNDGAISAITTTLFENINGIEAIETTIVTEDGATTVDWVATAPHLAWPK